MNIYVSTYLILWYLFKLYNGTVGKEIVIKIILLNCARINLYGILYQGHNMYKVEQLSHEQNSILGIWKVSDFSKSCHQLHIFSSFQFCVIQFCSQFHKLATSQPKICRVQMYVSFLVLVRWKLNVQIRTYFYYRPLLIWYGAILFFLQYI